MTPTVEEYATLLRISPPNPNKVFWKKSKKVPFRKKLAQMMNMDANVFVPITKLKGKNECVQCDFLERYIIENKNDDRVKDIFALVVYGTLIFPQSPGYIDVAVVDLIKQIVQTKWGIYTGLSMLRELGPNPEELLPIALLSDLLTTLFGRTP